MHTLRPTRHLLSAVLSLTVVLAACTDTPSAPDLMETEPTGLLQGRIVSPGLSTFADIEARITWGDLTLSAPVQADGAFDIEVPLSVGGLGTLTLEPGVFAPVHPGWALVGTGDLDAGRGTLVLAPRSWTPSTGDYAGVEVPIDPEMAADTRVMPSFWGFFFPYEQNGFSQNVTDRTTWSGELRSWPMEAYPIPVALDRLGSNTPISDADSVAFWTHVDRMEQALGFDAFQPTPLEDVQILSGTRRAAEAILVRVDTAQAIAGYGIVSRPEPQLWSFATDARTWSGNFAERVSIVSADIAYGIVGLASTDGFADQGLVIHEMMHTLGAGHGCSWASVQTYCASLKSDIPTPADVGHLLAMLEMRALEREYGSRFGVFASVIGHRSVTLGLSPLPAPDLLYGPASAPEDWTNR